MMMRGRRWVKHERFNKKGADTVCLSDVRAVSIRGMGVCQDEHVDFLINLTVSKNSRKETS